MTFIMIVCHKLFQVSSLHVGLGLGINCDDETCSLVGFIRAGNDQVLSLLQTVKLNQFS